VLFTDEENLVAMASQIFAINANGQRRNHVEQPMLDSSRIFRINDWG
jgi:hypothetical protein